jgi:hypothetical protein
MGSGMSLQLQFASSFAVLALVCVGLGLWLEPSYNTTGDVAIWGVFLACALSCVGSLLWAIWA